MQVTAILATVIAMTFLIYKCPWPTIGYWSLVLMNRALHWSAAIGLYILFENCGVKELLKKVVKGLA